MLAAAGVVFVAVAANPLSARRAAQVEPSLAPRMDVLAASQPPLPAVVGEHDHVVAARPHVALMELSAPMVEVP